VENRNEIIPYWEEVIVSPEIEEQCPKAIEKLRKQNYLAADLDQKKKNGKRVFSIKENDTIRVLFTTVIMDGKRCAYVMEISLDHKYKKLKSMKDHGVEKRLASVEAQKNITNYISEQKKKSEIEEKISLSPHKLQEKNGYTLEYVDAYLLGNKWFELNTEQQIVAAHA